MRLHCVTYRETRCQSQGIETADNTRHPIDHPFGQGHLRNLSQPLGNYVFAQLMAGFVNQGLIPFLIDIGLKLIIRLKCFILVVNLRIWY